jgi:hypothetical protein
MVNDELITKNKDQLLRLIDINSENIQTFPSNMTKTAKYNMYNIIYNYLRFTFLPLSVFYQFTNYFNIYFLIVTILISIKSISNLEPLTGIIPFVFVLGVSLIRELIENLVK